MQADTDALLDTISTLAAQMARTCPDCGNSASHIVKLVGEIRAAALDTGALRDALEVGTVGSDLSEAQVSAAVEAAARAARSRTEDGA